MGPPFFFNFILGEIYCLIQVMKKGCPMMFYLHVEPSIFLALSK